MSVSEQGKSEQAQAVLDELPMLKLMPEDVRRLLVNSFIPVSFEFGSVIVQEGDGGRRLLCDRRRAPRGR